MSFHKPVVGIYTLGCKVSQYESACLEELFIAKGFVCAPYEDECDVYVINTCTVTAESDRKCRQIIRRAAKKRGVVIVCGCYAQINPGKISAIEGVDYICGSADKTKIPDIALTLISGKRTKEAVVDIKDLSGCSFENMSVKNPPRTRAYIKIQDGCEGKCAYCIIPLARGPVRSKKPEDITAEAAYLAQKGCREIVLTGIEISSYGKDLEGASLPDVLNELDKIKGLERIRLGSLDPSFIKPDFVACLKNLRFITPHFHLSVQSASSRVLALMKRPYNAKQLRAAVELLNDSIPDVCFTGDFIVGFPGETDADFVETAQFISDAGFLNTHIFPYSIRKGTAAASYENQVPEEVKRRRASYLSEASGEISNKVIRGFIERGRSFDVLFESRDGEYALGHTSNFIEVRVPCKKDLRGEIYPVILKEVSNKIATGEIIN